MGILTSVGVNQSANALQNTPAANVSIAAYSGLYTFGSGIGLLIIILIGLLICGLVLALLANWESYKKMKGIFGWLSRTLDHFLYGLLTLLLFGIPAGLIYEVTQTAFNNPGAVSFIGEAIGVIIVAYFIIAGLGYLMRPIYAKIKKNMERDKKKAIVVEGVKNEKA